MERPRALHRFLDPLEVALGIKVVKKLNLCQVCLEFRVRDWLVALVLEPNGACGVMN